MVNRVENIKTYFKVHLGYIVAIIILLITVVCGYFMFVNKEDSVLADDITKKEVVKKEKKATTLKVDVKGAVKKPGVYELKVGSRVIDAVNMAGGLTDKANTSIINLSKVLKDAFVIVIYTDNDLKDVVMDKYVENNYSCPSTINDACIVEEDLITKSDTDDKTNSSANSKTTNSVNNKKTIKTDNQSKTNTTNGTVNLNTASLEELETLTGIGESKAQAIITYRQENGGFKSIDELTNVSGIGESTFEKIKDNITV